VAVAGYEHVLLISVDGLHSLDAELYAALKPDSAIASFYQRGVVYKNASTSRPSDSFPGLMAQITGAHSKVEHLLPLFSAAAHACKRLAAVAAAACAPVPCSLDARGCEGIVAAGAELLLCRRSVHILYDICSLPV
jgi:hypothetical protein